MLVRLVLWHVANHSAHMDFIICPDDRCSGDMGMTHYNGAGADAYKTVYDYIGPNRGSGINLCVGANYCCRVDGRQSAVSFLKVKPPWWITTEA